MKTILSLAIITTLLGTSVGEAFWKPNRQGPPRKPNQVFENNDIEKPEDWGVMTREERREYLESQGVTPKPPRQRVMHQRRQNAIQNQDIDLPEDWKEKDGEAKKEYLQDAGFVPPKKERRQNLIEEQGIDLPDDWDELDAEAKKEYLEESGFEPPERAEVRVERFQHRQDYGQVQQKRRQARNYRKFQGKLKERREFKDENKIKRKAAVEFLQRRGIIDGYEDGSFGPGNPINRAESLKVLFESVGEGPDEVSETEFDDVPGNAWFAGYVRKARARNIAKGYTDGTFRPAKTVNQVELLKLAFETFGIDLDGYDTSKLPEGVDQNAWFAPYLAYALDNGLLDTDAVDPATGMTREEFSEVMYRLIKQQEELQGIDFLEELSKKGLL